MVLYLLLSAELEEKKSYFLPYKHPEQIKKEGNVRWMGLTVNHPPTQFAPVANHSGYHSNWGGGIFKGQAAAQGIL